MAERQTKPSTTAVVFKRRNRASHQTHANLIRSACVSGMFDDEGNALPVIHVFDKYTRGKVPTR